MACGIPRYSKARQGLYWNILGYHAEQPILWAGGGIVRFSCAPIDEPFLDQRRPQLVGEDDDAGEVGGCGLSGVGPLSRWSVQDHVPRRERPAGRIGGHGRGRNLSPGATRAGHGADELRAVLVPPEVADVWQIRMMIPAGGARNPVVEMSLDPGPEDLGVELVEAGLGQTEAGGGLGVMEEALAKTVEGVADQRKTETVDELVMVFFTANKNGRRMEWGR